MKKFFKVIFVILAVLMTLSAIFLLISEPKEIGSYTALTVCLFFDAIGYLALYKKSSRLYQLIQAENIENED